MYIERPGSPSATTVAPASKRRSTSIEIRRSRLASERPPKKGVATRKVFRSGELITISRVYASSRRLTALIAAHFATAGTSAFKVKQASHELLRCRLLTHSGHDASAR